MPFPISFPSISLLVTAHQAHVGVSDEDLAEALGYKHASIITLIKNGTMRLPLTKVAALAEALSADPRALLRHAMAETMPGLYEMVEAILNPLALCEPGSA